MICLLERTHFLNAKIFFRLLFCILGRNTCGQILGGMYIGTIEVRRPILRLMSFQKGNKDYLAKVSHHWDICMNISSVFLYFSKQKNGALSELHN